MIINLYDTGQHMHIELVTWSNILTASRKRVLISPKCVTSDEIEHWLQEIESDIAAIRRKLDRREESKGGETDSYHLEHEHIHITWRE